MGFLEFFLGGLLIYGMLRGIWNGFFAELASLASLLAGIFVAIKFSSLMKLIIEPHVPWNPNTIWIVSFALTFILVIIGISILAKALTSIANLTGLGILNKLLGGILGFLKMVLILSVALGIFARINQSGTFSKKDELDRSWFYNPILKTSLAIYPSLANLYAELKPEVTSVP